MTTKKNTKDKQVLTDVRNNLNDVIAETDYLSVLGITAELERLRDDLTSYLVDKQW